MENSEKNRKNLTGHLSEALMIGRPAKIVVGNLIYQTSNVNKITLNTSKVLMFSTEHTFYTVYRDDCAANGVTAYG